MNSENSYPENRRTVLKTIGAASFGLTGAGAGTVVADDDSDDDTVEIILAKHKDKNIKTKEVPSEWYDRVKRARKGQNNLSESYGNAPWFVESARASNEEKTIGEYHAPILELGVTDKAKVPDDVPDEKMEYL